MHDHTRDFETRTDMPFITHKSIKGSSTGDAIATFTVNLVAIIAIMLATFVAIDTARASETGPATTTIIASSPAEPVSEQAPTRATMEAMTKLASALVRPNDMNTGALLFPSTRDGYYVQAPKLRTSVRIDVSGPIARTTVIQSFENLTDGWVEGVYVFPLPENSAVDTLKMRIGDRLIEGVIQPRAKAREIYEQAKREGKKAALLEQQRPNIFTNAVANIGPGESVVIRMEYQQTVKQDAGEFSLRFPMVVAPRYNPQPVIQQVDFSNRENGGSGNTGGWGQVDPVPDRDAITPPVLDPRENARINPVTLTVTLDAGFPLGPVKSHHHTMKEVASDETSKTLALQNESVPADKDFELTWTARGTAPSAALFKQEVDGETYVLAFVTPPKNLSSDAAAKPRESIFVIDNSGSMGGESIRQAKAALAVALKDLTPEDTFNIVRFDNTHEVVFPDAVRADRENVSTALAFVAGLEAEGGTEMLSALHAALKNPTDNSGERLRQVIFITDGAIGNEQQLFDVIARNRGESRVFTIGIGSAPNTFFMARAAELGRGTFTHIGSTDQVQARMADLFEKLKNPVMVNLGAKLAGGGFGEFTPNPVPDLYLGEPVVVSGRLVEDNGTILIDGILNDQPWQVSMDIANAAEGSGIAKLWARRKIAELESRRSYGSNLDAIDKQIEQTAMQHGLVSRLTSLVAVDVTPSRPQGEALSTGEVPTNLPDGWDYDKVFGEQSLPGQPMPQPASGPQRAFLKQAAGQSIAMVASAPTAEDAANVASKQRQQITLPQTATPADRLIMIGLLLLLLATMIAVTSRMWRRTGRRISAQEQRQRRAMELDE